MTISRLLSSRRAAVRYYLDLLRFGDRPLRLDALPAARQVVVLAPHADDEALGCGGVIRMYREASVPVGVIILADDDASNRREEAARAAAVLGASPPVFLGLRDGAIGSAANGVELLHAQLAALQPDVVFLPFVTDQHPDHVATNRLFVAACGRSESLQPTCWGYEAWTPLYANRLVDITGVADRKWAALGCYESQLAQLDYLRAVQGLNAYRHHTMYKRAGFAEAFFAASFDEYRRLVMAFPK